MSELRPVEILKPAGLLSAETEKVLLSHTRHPLVNELKPVLEFWDAEKTIHELKIVYKCISDIPASGCSEGTDRQITGSDVFGGSENFPSVLSGFINAREDGNVALSALGGAIYYLKQAFLDETLLRFAKFEPLPSSGFGDVNQQYLMLDAAALENLEIFENSRNGGSSG